ncbi:uroporphyrinogen-III C-methyltransferase [Lentisalinibacter sediminis]|uniref:uroporphyrinogen-III C-methyltransferase n=1 Tax=Lentisalinibacter sediminis TaxID=2992237 RepID=UPI00386D16B3
MTEQEKPGSKTAADDDAQAGAGQPEDREGREPVDESEAAARTRESPVPADDTAETATAAPKAAFEQESGESPAAQPADDAGGTAAPVPGGGGNDGSGGGGRTVALVAALALVLALAAAGFSGYGWWLERSAGADTADLEAAVDTLETRAAENADTVAELRGRLSSLQQSVQQAQQSARQAADADEFARLRREFRESRDIVESLPGRMENLEESMANLQGVSAGARDAWLVAEAEYYMQLANAQAQLAGNAELAAFALELADRRIRELGDPVYTPVRRELADEITALRAVEDVDIEGVTLTLASLADVIQSLPLDEEVTPEDRPRPEIGEELSGFSRAWTAVKNALSDMVSVRRTNEQLEPLLSPEAQYFLRTNIALQLQTARLALLQGEGAIFRQSLEDARSWLERYFDREAKAVSGAVETIAELADSPVAAELPDISASLRLFRQRQALAQGDGRGADEGAE